LFNFSCFSIAKISFGFFSLLGKINGHTATVMLLGLLLALPLAGMVVCSNSDEEDATLQKESSVLQTSQALL